MRLFTLGYFCSLPSASQFCSGAMVMPNCDCHRTTMWRMRSSTPQQCAPPLIMGLIAGTACIFICPSSSCAPFTHFHNVFTYGKWSPCTQTTDMHVRPVLSSKEPGMHMCKKNHVMFTTVLFFQQCIFETTDYNSDQQKITVDWWQGGVTSTSNPDLQKIKTRREIGLGLVV